MNTWENDYLKLCAEVNLHGALQETRVGWASAMYGKSLSILVDSHQFPLLTTRKMYYKPIFGELAAFLKGAAYNSEFIAEGCSYWTANGTQWNKSGFTDALHSDFNDLYLGKIYGYQWLNFNGYNQLAKVREQLIHDRSSRRIVMSAWNPNDLADMCLPPCHITVQFHVDGNDLSCSVYMRSVDLALGLPSDVVLYYALMVVLADEAGLSPAGLHFHFGNAHVYHAHRELIKGQLGREVQEPPSFRYVDKFQFGKDCIIITDYRPMEAIRYELLA